MNAQVLTVEELIGYLNEIVEAYGDIPAVVVSRVDGLVESVGRPRVLSLPPACAVDNFQAYVYSPRPDAPYPDNPPAEVALIR